MPGYDRQAGRPSIERDLRRARSLLSLLRWLVRMVSR